MLLFDDNAGVFKWTGGGVVLAGVSFFSECIRFKFFFFFFYKWCYIHGVPYSGKVSVVFFILLSFRKVSVSWGGYSELSVYDYSRQETDIHNILSDVFLLALCCVKFNQ